VRRFAMSHDSQGLVRIRQYGLVAHRDRGEPWRCRALAAGPRDQSPPSGDSRCSTEQRLILDWGGTSAVSVSSSIGIGCPACPLPILVFRFAHCRPTADTASLACVPQAFRCGRIRVLVEDRAPGVVVGKAANDWRPPDPGTKHQGIPILDMLMTRLHLKPSPGSIATCSAGTGRSFSARSMAGD